MIWQFGHPAFCLRVVISRCTIKYLVYNLRSVRQEPPDTGGQDSEVDAEIRDVSTQVEGMLSVSVASHFRDFAATKLERARRDE